MLAAAFICISCFKEDNTPDISDKGMVESVAFAAAYAPQSKTSLVNGEVRWTLQDRVSLFSGGNYATKTELSVTSLSEDAATAQFEGMAEVGSYEYVAIYPSMESNAYDAASASFTVSIPSEQLAVADGFMSRANVAVASSRDNSLLFRNVGALLGIRMTGGDAVRTASVRIKARRPDGQMHSLTGTSQVSVDHASGAMDVSEGSSDHVTLRPPEGGFKDDVTYYMVVYPGEYNGFDITFTDKEGYDFNVSDPTYCKVECSQTLDLGKIRADYESLPDDLEIVIDFRNGWPFVEAAPTASFNDKTYTYRHTYVRGSRKFTADFKYNFTGSGTTYTWNNKYITTDVINCRITLFGVPGKYLKSVAMTTNNGHQYSKKFQIVNTAWETIAESEGSCADHPASVTFPFGDNNTQMTERFYMRFPLKNTYITSITLVYTKDEPTVSNN